MMVASEFRASLGSKPKKEMLSIVWEKPASPYMLVRPVVYINSSSLEIIQSCKRKALYALKEELRSENESPATLFGSSIHKALEVWYKAPRVIRGKKTSDCIEPGALSGTHTLCLRCAAIEAFLEVSQPLQTLDFKDKRHPSNGVKILHTYFDKYLDDPFEVVVDEAGPMVERRFEFVLHDEPSLKIIYFGTLDAVFKNVETGTTIVVDHKTTSALGIDFYQRVKPNFQYTGYVMGAQRALGVDTDLFMVNGLQVAKTKCEFARQVTQRTEEDFDELKKAVLWSVRDYIDSQARQDWPQSTPNACCMWGGCSYRSICEAPASIREQVKKNMFQTQENING